MDLTGYELKDVFITALKSEKESYRVYKNLANIVNNAFLKDKLEFLAKEEVKHYSFLAKAFDKLFSKSDIELPEKSPIPLPEIKIDDELMEISEILSSAMEAEKAASRFYLSMAKLVRDHHLISKTLKYLAQMEIGHYKLLEIERENIADFENFQDGWPLMHVGP